MSESDQILSAFHPLAGALLFERLHAFELQAGSIDRRRDEQRYRALCEQHVQTLRQHLQQQALRLLQQHQGAPQIGATDLHLQQLILDYVHQFVQRIS
jgi:hypothetical protein